MDLDEDDFVASGNKNSRTEPSSKPSRFLPKSSKLKPKPKEEPSEESKPAAVAAEYGDDAPVMVKQEDSKMLVDPSVVDSVTDAKMEDVAKPEEEEQELPEPIEEEDVVVREIDVFLQPSPLDSNTKLYVVQQTLRPSWRPYEMEGKCLEIRVKPESVKVEIDLKLEVDKNYDENAEECKKITKQTLVSEGRPVRSCYAVGLLEGNKLHLNPVHAVVQLRPSYEHLKPGGLQKTNASQNVGSLVNSSLKSEESLPVSVKKQVKIAAQPIEQVNIADEPWVPLQYYGLDSSFSSKYRQIMAVQQSSPIPFSMSLEDYVNSLCPRPSAETNKPKGPLRSDCLSLQLNERLKKWFHEGLQVNRFNALKHLAPDCSDEDLLEVLPRYADLVQGLWVSKSTVLGLPNADALVRDYVLLLFSKNSQVLHKEIELLKLPKDKLRSWVTALASFRKTFGDWKFKEPTDVSFINEHPNIVKKQEQLWEGRAKNITEHAHGPSRGGASMRNSPKPSMSSKPSGPGSSDQGARRSVDGTANSATLAMSDETREALPNALKKILHLHKVCNLQFICQTLRDMAVNQSNLPKADSRVFVAAARAVSALPQLESAVNEVAIKIHGVYVSKSSEDAALNPLRNAVIDFLSVKEPNAKIKRAEIVEFANTLLKTEIKNSEYSQVLNELCFSVKGNAWVLKTGDGSRHPT